jgi:hypothetical protein
MNVCAHRNRGNEPLGELPLRNERPTRGCA